MQSSVIKDYPIKKNELSFFDSLQKKYFCKINRTIRKRKFFVRYNLVTEVKLNVFMHLKFLTIPQNHYEQYLINTLIRQLI